MRLWHAVLAGLQVFSGGSILTDLIPRTYVGLLVLVVAALQAGTVIYSKPDQVNRAESDSEPRSRVGVHRWQE